MMTCAPATAPSTHLCNIPLYGHVWRKNSPHERERASYLRRFSKLSRFHHQLFNAILRFCATLGVMNAATDIMGSEEKAHLTRRPDRWTGIMSSDEETPQRWVLGCGSMSQVPYWCRTTSIDRQRKNGGGAGPFKRSAKWQGAIW